MKARHLVIGLALALGNWSGSAHAIEMFTNFNNGMETGTRPLGIDPMGPVRFHANQHEALWPGRWQQQARCMAGPQPVEFNNQPAMPPADGCPPRRNRRRNLRNRNGSKCRTRLASRRSAPKQCNCGLNRRCRKPTAAQPPFARQAMTVIGNGGRVFCQSMREAEIGS